MQISSRFTIAVHALAYIDLFESQMRVTSAVLAQSIRVNPVIIRGVLSDLKAAGIVDARKGSGGTWLARPLSAVTLYDVFAAVDPVGGASGSELFHFHENPAPQCVVGGNIHTALDDKLQAAQDAMEEQLRSVTLDTVVADLVGAARSRGQEVPEVGSAAA
ncbi:transcriptional regulator [Alloscardovia macacae]|uniref:Rrf2 family transcriptional regulator n=1 Tax=Alloscardovia macacae TaxID=1160091 RepID=UPI000A2E38B6|nr:Rrf2 family transcriptional regulator [Alloscardovia macacae]OTA26560.1 transcriptional regulator [Alloscardovia macacae]